jgi:hypothetical protein
MITTRHLLIPVFCALSAMAIAQRSESISRTNEKVIIESSRQVVSSYAKYLELIAQEKDKDVIALYEAELFKTVQRDSVNVFNDLIPVEDRPKNPRENVDRLTTYLNDIGTRYQEGVKLIYTDIQTSKVFIDTMRSRLFVKVTANRVIDGTYFYKDIRKSNKATERIDFYVRVELKSSGVPESRIFSIFIHQDNEATFRTIKVVEKTAPIEFVGIMAYYKRATEQTVAWQGGEIFERLRLDLYKERGGNQPIRVTEIDTSFVNDNKISFLLNKKLKPGKGSRYFLQITKMSSEEQPVKSQVFYIKRKMPLVWQIGLPVIFISGVGAVIVILNNKANETKDVVITDPLGPG